MSEQVKESKEKDRIPDFVNLEEFRYLKGELEALKDTDLDIRLLKAIFTIELPEILIETMKILSAFDGKSIEEYKRFLFVSSLSAAIEEYFGGDFGKALYKLCTKYELYENTN